MVVARYSHGQLNIVDRLRETVRLAAGLDEHDRLSREATTRALGCLERFGQRLHDMQAGRVRVVGTNTLRKAKRKGAFLDRAREALGHPIEIISGVEEARLIYLGVAHTLPNPDTQQLVMDIGGGSTEFIIGRKFQPLQLESLYMGCVSYSLRFFPHGRVDKRAMKEAELAARRELQGIVHAYKETGWEEAVGSSGTAKAIADLLELNGFSERGITRDGLDELRARLLRAGDASRMQIEGLRADRIPVLPGGLAIMSAAFKEFGLERMEFSEGALRLGVLYDLLGRYHHDDLREATVGQFMQRYTVDRRQVARVSMSALTLLHQILPESREPEHVDAQFLVWAARLHEIGVSVAHSSYHKHSAYILSNADMPGFSRRDQARLARVVLGHRGKLERVTPAPHDSADWLMIFALRTAALLHRARDDLLEAPVEAGLTPRGFQLAVADDWLESVPLTAAGLEEEVRQWAAVGLELKLRRRRAKD
jgi:exopolyphosphatase/guanosine-5'-triphosphate,3'-diphosphate pyrophosphatase